MKPVDVIVLGAGSRGTGYSNFIKQHGDMARLVGVAEPRDFYRERLVREHNIPAANVAKDWREFANRPKFADMAMVCMLDHMHTEPAIAMAKKKYNILLEKPMAPTLAECEQIVAAVNENKVQLAVCHVMRYTPYTQKLKSVVESGLIGEVVSMQHQEPVGYWHQAHSFVRGNFRNTSESVFMLLAKSCHDVDWIAYIMGKPCKSVSSFGSLFHFRKEHQPAGAADRCLDCPAEIEFKCPYSARKIYLGRVAAGRVGWPVEVLTPQVTPANVAAALRNGPYGRCVFACDNNVVDNQVVNLLFEGGRTVTFSMNAFNRSGHRLTKLFGTLGEIYCDGEKLEHFDFLSDTTRTIPIGSSDALSGHGGGDAGLMRSFLTSLQENDPSKVLSGPAQTLESHRMVFAAEKARVENCVVNL